MPAPGAIADVGAITACLRGQLSAYEVPRQITLVDVIPKAASGKILRRLLRHRVAAE